MVIIDMLRNRHSHPELTLEDYLMRHYLLGGANLCRLDGSPEKLWKLDDAKERVNFLRHVYDYAHDTEAHKFGLMFFSTWVRFRGLTEELQW